ncbi:hypothetical protein R3P38DRAFT_1755041 [Favolaschia claudopus]|uniref:DUF6533 domain-containing protein n=1 Tax=Favolaschia claudopus TaxID=2862362 RepID=A0AAW0DI85_9AGAR
MSAGPFADGLPQLIADLEKTRFVSAAGFVILVYDHLLSFSDEVRFIWSASWTSSKILFLGLRYSVPILMTGHTVQLSGLSNTSLSDEVSDLLLVYSAAIHFFHQFCKVWDVIGLVLGWITIAANDWLVLLRLWVLWDRNRMLVMSTFLIFVLCTIGTMVATVIAITDLVSGIQFEPLLGICSFRTQFTNGPSKALRVLWIPGITFEFVMILAIGWKIYKQPKTLADLISEARPSLLFVTVFFTWCFTTTATCRMILRLRRYGSSYASPSKPSDSYMTETLHERQMSVADLELAWLREQSMSATRDQTPTSPF